MPDRTGCADENHDDLAPVVKRRPSDGARRRPGRRRRSASRRWSWLGLLRRQPARTIVGAIASALVASIVINALFLQKAKHPAPLSPSARLHKTSVAARVHPASARHARTSAPGKTTAAAGERKDAIGALLRTNVADKVPVESKPTEAKSTDGIGALIRENRPAANEIAAPSAATVAAAQQALVRLGFVLHADGVLGSATRQAIEFFERDHRMPVDGDLSSRVIRQLSKASGMAIP